MPTINDLRQQAATIKNATQVGENTANRVGTTFETIADLLESMGVVANLSTIDIGSIDTLNTTGDMLVGTPNIYTLTMTRGSNTFKVGTLFQFANNGRYDVAQVIVSQYIIDSDGRIDTTSADQEVHIFYRLCKTMNGGSLPTPIGTWTTWTELGGSGGSGVTVDPYPTQDSGNAVSSGGVFERLQDIAPKVDISAIDDIDEYSDMLATKSPFYVVTKTLSGNVFRIGTLMEFANQGRYILYQILATDYVLNDDGTLDTTLSENGGLKLIWRMKQFSGNPPAGVMIGAWSAWSYLSGDSGYQPDNEDIDLNANDQLQFANKAYDASAFSGLGRVYLRKNIVQLNLTDKYFDGFVNDVLVQDVGTSSTPDAILFDTTRKMFVARVGLLYYVDWSSDEDYNPITRDANWNYNGNFYRWNGEELAQWDKTINQLTQAMVNTANTIYHIQYDYDLNGQTITLPAGCVLEFDGGSVKNGTITGNGTIVKDTDSKIFGNDVTIAGTWKNNIIHSSWFSNDAETIRQVFAMNNPAINTKVMIDGDYNVNISDSISIDGNTDVYLSGTLKKTSNSVPNYTMFQIAGSNVRFFGGVIDGNKSAFDTSDEYGHGIGVSGGAVNVLVSGVIVKDCRGDGFYIGSTSSPAENLRISGCEINGVRRNGISLIYAKNVEISDCKFYDINATDPGLAIDIEPNSAGQKNERISILRCEIDTCKSGISLTGTNEDIRDILVKDCKFNLDYYKYAMFWTGGKVKQLTIDSCEFNLKNHTSSYDFQISASAGLPVNARIVNCTIVSETASGYVFGNGQTDIVNCAITTASSVFQYLYANMENCIVNCTNMFFEYGGATDFVKIICGCVLNIKGVTISGRSAAALARNIVFENNIINSDTTYYPVLSNYAKNITFRNNVMYLKGTRRCMDFTNVDNITISNNRIKIGANYDVIQMNSPATNCQAKDNIFEVEEGVTFALQHYKGINKSTSTSNKIGDPFYDENLGKMLVYNGTAVVNLDGTPLT